MSETRIGRKWVYAASYDDEWAEEPDICRFWLQGRCAKGNTCWFKHEHRRAPTDGQYKGTQDMTCKFFLKVNAVEAMHAHMPMATIAGPCQELLMVSQQSLCLVQ